MIKKYKYGLYNNDILYGWDKHILYRLPQKIGLRFYGLKPCCKWKDGFVLGQTRRSKKQLEALTVVIDKEINLIKDKDLPF